MDSHGAADFRFYTYGNYMVLESHFASGIIEMSRVAVGGVGGLGVVVVCVCGG